MAFRDGVQIASSVVWCDATRARDLCFLSHAHVPVRGAHRKVLTSALTLALLRATARAPRAARAPRGTDVARDLATDTDADTDTRLPGIGEVLVAPTGRPFHLGGMRLELFPSGHVPGACSLHLTDTSGRRIAYAGDVNPLGTLGEPCEVRGADVLVLDAPLAALDAPLPPRAELAARLVESVRRARESGRAPVVLAPPLGVALETLGLLAGAGLSVRAHDRIVAYARASSTHGVLVPAPARFTGRIDAHEVLLWPLDAHDARPLARLPAAHRIALGAPSLDGSTAPFADESIPLCDHADRAALLAYIADTGARDVFLLGDPPPAFAAALAARKVAVHGLGPPSQMDLFHRA